MRFGMSMPGKYRFLGSKKRASLARCSGVVSSALNGAHLYRHGTHSIHALPSYLKVERSLAPPDEKADASGCDKRIPHLKT